MAGRARRPVVTRRGFLRSAAAAGAGLMLRMPRLALAEQAAAALAGLNVALIGAGSQGRTLLLAALKIPGVRFTAVCDIWPYHRAYAANILKEYGQPVREVEDYRELLAKPAGLDAVLIATPDWVHAEQTIACLKAGLHVYCEKEMATTLEDARRMVRAARVAGKRLQIGHQRRSNPRYLHAERFIHQEGLLGRITHAQGRWHRARREEQGWPRKHELDAATLKRYGYGTMQRLRNWRFFKEFSGGPIADLGSHQVDVLNWFLRARPTGVLASGGADYYRDQEQPDNVLAIYEYRGAQGPIRAMYDVINTSSHGGYTETFLGDAGSLELSEDPRVGFYFREPVAQKREWEDEAEKVKSMNRDAIELKVGETRTAQGGISPQAMAWEADSRKPIHQPHLENFFNAVRDPAVALNCPGETGYETAVAILKTNEALAAGKRVVLTPGDYSL